MSQMTLVKTRLHGGIWEGILTVPKDERRKPGLRATHLGIEVDGVMVSEDPKDGQWHVQVPVPFEAVADGVQTILIEDASSGDILSSFSLVAGEPLEDDIRSEVELLRAELDMLKVAFRRHCQEFPAPS